MLKTGDSSYWILIGVVVIACVIGSFINDNLFQNGEEPQPCWPDIVCPVPTMPGADGYMVLEDIRRLAFLNAGPQIPAVMTALVKCASDMPKAYPGGNTPHCEELISAHANALANNWAGCIADLEAGH